MQARTRGNRKNTKAMLPDTGQVSEPKNKTEMKEINGYSFLEVPEGSIRFWLDLNTVMYATKTGFGEAYNAGSIFTERQKLETLECTHEIIGLGKDLTEEQWKGIVESQKTFGYKKYDAVDAEYQWTARALQSGHSLLKANNLNPNTTLILKKIL